MVMLPGLDPSWSKYLDVPSSARADQPGTVHRWHYLDNSASLESAGVSPSGTLLCVHGNPTWSYLWRSLLTAGTSSGWRVLAVDQLEMGLSARTRTPRRLADRVNDLEDFVAAAGVTGPLVTVGHDWGGVISLGYACRNRKRLSAVVLTNTAIHQPAGRTLPAALRLALLPGLRRAGTRDTQGFLRVTHALARPRHEPAVHEAYLFPYRTAAAREGIAQFVADIPTGPHHPSYAALESIAEDVRSLDVPTLMLWGPHDPIFSDPYLDDLVQRIPHAQVHRFANAGHLVPDDADVAGALFRWLSGPASNDDAGPTDAVRPPREPTGDATGKPTSEPTGERAPFLPLSYQLVAAASSDAAGALAVAEMGAGGRIVRSLSWAELAADVEAVAAGMLASGLGPGARVSLMVPPGVDLTVLIYACLRVGAIMVVADAGLGARGLDRAVRASAPTALIGVDRALAAARLFGWPGRKFSVGVLNRTLGAALRVENSLDGLRTAGSSDSARALLASADTRADIAPGFGSAPATDADADADAAILFTSGSTGPAKGVTYTHRQLAAMREAIAHTFEIRPGGALVAGFAPFALLGPALGVASVTPDMDVTAPRTLTAAALAEAAAAIGATTVFASPAALRNVLDTAGSLTVAGRRTLSRVSLVLSAGAPIPEVLLRDLQSLVPHASLHTPYGMTEALPVTTIDLPGIEQARHSCDAGEPGAGNGVCVGVPVHGARIAVAALDVDGTPTGDPSTEPGVTGEILVNAPHVKDRYHRLWVTEQQSSRTTPWHRTGDVGHLDAAGRLWVEGRLAHLILADPGVITPVGIEQALEEIDGVPRAAVVGVGPPGTQVVVAIIETASGGFLPRRLAGHRAGVATDTLAGLVRQAGRRRGVSIAAVLTVPRLPTDIRHNSKIDRTRLARWASRALAGGRIGTP